MKGTRAGIIVIAILLLGVMGCSKKEKALWTVTCPWAETGVAAKVNTVTAAKVTEMSKQFTFEPTAVKGDAKTVNEWIA